MDQRKFPSLSSLKTHLVYVFGGEQDYTDEETAKALVGAVVSNGKKGEYHIIPGAGHEICCGDKRALDLQYEFLKGLIDTGT
jgi:dipeptidyl aminopeptidase/acylaminoacyl peptidase